jgi:hypothetical protein
MDFVIRHPRDRTWIARYGADPELGCWAEVPYSGVIVVCDQNEVGFDGERPALSVLNFLAGFGFIFRGDVDAALAWLDEENSHSENFWRGPPWWSGRGHRQPRGVRRVLRIISNLDRADG